jgi:hypothetical protein
MIKVLSSDAFIIRKSLSNRIREMSSINRPQLKATIRKETGKYVSQQGRKGDSILNLVVG